MYTNGNGHHAPTLDLGVAHNGRSKIERYKWASTTDRGELRWVDKRLIKIDHSYQRELNEKKVVEIAREFSWPAFGVVVCAQRPDGLYAVDAQHRVAAALRRSDVVEVPCIIFQSGGVASEAKSFLDANGKRKPVTAIDKYKAKVVTEDPDTLLVQRLIEMSGRSISRAAGAKSLRCIYKMQQLAKDDAATLERIWPLVVDLCEGNHLQERILDAFFYIEKHMKDGDSILNKRWCQRIMKAGYVDVFNAINSSAAFYAKGGAKVFAQGVLRVVNKGLQESHQLSLTTD